MKLNNDNKLDLIEKINIIGKFEIWTYRSINDDIIKKCVINRTEDVEYKSMIFSNFSYICGNFFKDDDNNILNCEVILFEDISDLWFYTIINIIKNYNSNNIHDSIKGIKNFFSLKSIQEKEQIGLMAELLFAYHLYKNKFRYSASLYKKSQFDFNLITDKNINIKLDIKGTFSDKETCTINHFPNRDKSINYYLLIQLKNGEINIYELIKILKKQSELQHKQLIDKTENWFKYNEKTNISNIKISLDLHDIYIDNNKIDSFNKSIDSIFNNKMDFIWLNSLKYVVNIDAFNKVNFTKLKEIINKLD